MMIPDSKWLDALTLPLKAMIGAALASGTLLLLVRLGLLDFSQFDSIARPIIITIFVVFSVLSVVSVVDLLLAPVRERQRQSQLAVRRAVRRSEQEDQRAETKARVLSRLDHLSKEEITYVADCLRDGSPTFYTYVYSPPVSTLTGKGLVWSPGGTHNQDHYPFSFHDFVWSALQDRKDEFIEKDNMHKKAQKIRDEAKRRKRGY